MNISKWARRGLSALVAVMVPASLVAANPALAAGKGGGGKPSGSTTSFVGRATGIAGTLLGETLVLSDVVLPKKGGALQDSALTLRANASTLGLGANLATDIAHVSTIGQLQQVDSAASLADVNLNLVNALGVNLLHLDTDLLMSKVWGVCNGGLPELGGWFNPAHINLRVLGVHFNLVVTAGHNQKIFDADVLGLGRVVITLNELAVKDGVITANALHVTVTSLAGGILTKTVDIVLSAAKAGIRCGLPVAKKGDFITGGGWVTTKDGHKANFAIAGGKKTDGTCWWGHLLFNDKHGNVVKANALTGCDLVGALEQLSTFDGIADPSTFTAQAADHGEPGSGDRFGLRHGTVDFIDPTGDKVDTIGGGNIQLHIARP